ncbi:hypothetical protein ABS767_09220 [Sphingomonas sp. ST-64]|uniref:Uncharacterized protein n=1 Tax=Sphingomonas plantiphila TaxID=3163295 RepID=A0ABW8YPN9_9SPHN
MTRLCPNEAAALMLDQGQTPTAAIEGCRWAIRETGFADNILLYRTLQCGGQSTTVELRVGKNTTELVYARRADGGPTRDADGQPLVLARVFAGMPGGRARAIHEARDRVGDKQRAARCTLRAPYHAEGLPTDALIVDVLRTRAEVVREDAEPLCGPLGYNPAGGSIEFWRTHQGHAWYFMLGTDIWDVDPGSFTIVRKQASGQWLRLTAPG